MAVPETIAVALASQTNWQLLASGAGAIEMYVPTFQNWAYYAFGVDAVTPPDAGIEGKAVPRGRNAISLEMVDGEHLYVRGLGSIEVNGENTV